MLPGPSNIRECPTCKRPLEQRTLISIPGYWKRHPLCHQIHDVAGGSFNRKSSPAIKGAGHVVRTLEAALWASYNSGDFRGGCLMAANLGDDADTTAAVYGQIAGAFHGMAGIPHAWLARLHDRDMITGLIDRLADRRRKLN